MPFLLLALGMLAYCNSPLGEYCFDDIYLIRDRAEIEDWSNLRLLVSIDYGPAFGDLSYRPLAVLTYFADAIWLGKSPFFSRWINILLHAATGMALFGLWRRLFGRNGLALLASAIFLVHPLTTETVNCPGFRREILALLLMSLTLRMLFSAATLGKVWLAAAAAPVWLLAMLAKEPAIMLVLLAPILLKFRARAADRQSLKLKISEWILVLEAMAPALLAYLALYWNYSSHQGESIWPGGRGPALGFLNFCRSFLLYLRLWLYPAGLSVGHYFEPSTSYSDARAWLALLAFVLFAGGSAAAYFKGWIAGAGGLWTCLMFVPLMQFLPSPELVAERYAYMPHAGFSLLLAAALYAIRGKFSKGDGAGPRRAWIGAFCLIVAVYTALTLKRNCDWSDDVTLNIRRYELWDNAEGKMALGALYFRQEDWKAAESSLRDAIRLAPSSDEARRNLGLALLRNNRIGEARRHLEDALGIDPSNEKNQQAMQLLDAAVPGNAH
jgi:tetratricopeptide (TPR) repeat protein